MPGDRVSRHLQILGLESNDLSKFTLVVAHTRTDNIPGVDQECVQHGVHIRMWRYMFGLLTTLHFDEQDLSAVAAIATKNHSRLDRAPLKATVLGRAHDYPPTRTFLTADLHLLGSGSMLPRRSPHPTVLTSSCHKSTWQTDTAV